MNKLAQRLGTVTIDPAGPIVAGSIGQWTITLTVGGEPGGGYDLDARVVARHLGRFIPGNPKLVVANLRLGRGLINANQLRRGAQQLSCIYHVQRDFLLEALSDSKDFKEKLDRMVQAGRLRSLADFLTDLNRDFGTGAAPQPPTPDQMRQQRRRSR